jgi:hypothetical protein
MLARVLWAMAFQRSERTVFVIEGSHLCPNPFDADRSSPVLIVNTDLGGTSAKARTELKQLLPWRQPSDGRVVMQSHGLDSTIAADSLQDELQRSGDIYIEERQRRRVDYLNGFVEMSGTAPTLKNWAVWLSTLGERSFQGMSYTELDWPDRNGEFQVFRDFDARVSQAKVNRQRLFPGREHDVLSDGERQVVWRLG